jgi:excisionase family DNA binding protein
LVVFALSERRDGDTIMVTIAGLNALRDLEKKLAETGQAYEAKAVQEAITELSEPVELISATEAAKRLSVPIPTIEDWIGRGTLRGGRIRGRTIVTRDSVEGIVRLREVLNALDEEGNPTFEEIQELEALRPGRPVGQVVASN